MTERNSKYYIPQQACPELVEWVRNDGEHEGWEKWEKEKLKIAFPIYRDSQ